MIEFRALASISIHKPSIPRKTRTKVENLNVGGGGRAAGRGAGVSTAVDASVVGSASVSSGTSGSGAEERGVSSDSGIALGLPANEAPQERVHLHQLLLAHRLVEVDDDADHQEHAGAARAAHRPYEIGPGRQRSDRGARDH